MIDIFKIPLYYIAFKPNQELVTQLKKIGFKSIHHFQAIDGRKMDIDYLLKNNIITIRSYYDLLQGREQHSGLSSLGAVGCTMSHDALWNLCVKNNMPYIIIAEDDLDIDKITQEDEKKIQKILEKPNTVYVGRNIHKSNGKPTFFIGLQFYIVSYSAAKELIKLTYPIDVQTDWYMAHLDTLNKINVEGFSITDQKSHISTVQEPFCYKCTLAKKYVFKVLWFLIPIIILIILGIILYSKLRKCQTNCPVSYKL